MASKKKQSGRPVIVCTEYRGVFFGYADKTSGDVIALKGARNCISWSKSIGGVLGLASRGPDSNCRIGARADIELRKITAVMAVSPDAVKAWEDTPCVS